jgi:hypothetical protein
LRASSRTARGALLEACAFVTGVVLLALFQWPALITGSTTLRHDHIYWGVPVYGFFAESVGLGRLPLWNPFTHGGEPFYLPLFQLRLLDPPALLVALAGWGLGSDPVTLYAWDRFVRGVVVGAGSYLVLRIWARQLLTRLSLIPIVLFSSVQWSLVRQMAVAEQFLVAPLVLLFFLRIVYLADNRWRNWIAGALLLGLNFQSYFFSGTMILLTVFTAGLLLFQPRLLVRLRLRPGLSARLAAAAAIVLVMLLPSIVLLFETGRFIFPPRVVDYAYEDKGPNQGPPQYEPRDEIRSTRPILFPYRLQFHIGTHSAPGDFVQLFAPFGNEYARPAGRSWGKPSEAFMYVGMLPLAVALLGVVAGRNSLKRVWLLTLVILGLLMLGPQGFLHALLYWIFPPLWFVRNTHTLVLFLVLALLYFYVLGCNRILGRRPVVLPGQPPASGPLTRVLGPRLARLAATIGLTTGVVLMVVTLGRVRYPLTFYTLPILGCTGVLGWWLRSDLGHRGLYWSVLVGWSTAVSLLAARGHDRTSVFFLCVFLALPLLAWGCWNARGRNLARLGVGLALGAAIILVIHRLVLLAHGGFAVLGLTAGFSVSLVGAAGAAIVLAIVGRDLLRDGPPALSRGSLAMLLALISALDLAAYSGYLMPLVRGPRPDGVLLTTAPSGTFPPTRAVTAITPPSAEFEEAIRYLELSQRTPAAFSPFFTAPDAPPDRSDPAATINALIHGQRASTFLMTRGYYDLVRSGASGAALAEIFAIDRPLIQFRRDWVWLGRAEARRALADAVSTTASRSLVRTSVILEKPPAGVDEEWGKPPRGGDAGPWRSDVRRYDYNSLELEVEAPVRGVLYWADGFDPSWRAWVDGKEVPVHRANLAFKAVFVPAGRHAVRFEYRPTPIVVTGLLFVALGFVGALAAIWALVTPPRLPRLALGGGGVSLTGGPARR